MPEIDRVDSGAVDVLQVGTFGGEENVKMNLKVWCEAVGDYPLYAVQKAVR